MVAENNAALQACVTIVADRNHTPVDLTEDVKKRATRTVVLNSSRNHVVRNTATATCEAIHAGQNTVALACIVRITAERFTIATVKVDRRSRITIATTITRVPTAGAKASIDSYSRTQ
jgi:hypothetical protein